MRPSPSFRSQMRGKCGPGSLTKTEPERNRSTGRIQGEPKASGEQSGGFDEAAGVVRGRGVGGGMLGGPAPGGFGGESASRLPGKERQDSLLLPEARAGGFVLADLHHQPRRDGREA